MGFIRILAGIGCVLLGIYALITVVQGLGSGDIIQLSKHGNAILHRASQPERFWINISFWTIAGVMLIGGGVNMVRKNF